MGRATNASCNERRATSALQRETANLRKKLYGKASVVVVEKRTSFFGGGNHPRRRARAASLSCLVPFGLRYPVWCFFFFTCERAPPNRGRGARPCGRPCSSRSGTGSPPRQHSGAQATQGPNNPSCANRPNLCSGAHRVPRGCSPLTAHLSPFTLALTLTLTLILALTRTLTLITGGSTRTSLACGGALLPAR